MDCKPKLNKQLTGDRIYQAIDKSKITKEKIAEELGLKSPRVIYEWTNGKKLPKLEHLVHLSWMLGVRIEDLLVIE
ncbi:MAG: helix-turn-helix transcriptional regulator [Clostridia bacterium]|nr:helix-turn-helix transcriptional regulator [Clostridia bacterium]